MSQLQHGDVSEPACAGLPAQPSDRHPLRGVQAHQPHHALPEVGDRESEFFTKNLFRFRFNRIREVEPELGQLTNLTNLSIRENQVGGIVIVNRDRYRDD